MDGYPPRPSTLVSFISAGNGDSTFHAFHRRPEAAIDLVDVGIPGLKDLASLTEESLMVRVNTGVVNETLTQDTAEKLELRAGTIVIAAQATDCLGIS